MADRDQLYNDSETAMKIALEGLQANLWTALPGFITEVRMDEQTVDVQLTVQASVTDEAGAVTYVNLPKLIHCPIVWPQGGGFALTFPLKVNDEVFVQFASRAVDAWWQSGGIQKPVEYRMHDLSDGFALVGIKSVPNVLENISTTDVQLRNDSGETFVSITDDGKIKLKATSIEIDGDVKVTGKIEATEDVVAGVLVPAAAVHLLTHVHTSAAPGNPTTPPTPGS